MNLPTLLLERALLRYGRGVVDGLDHQSLTEKVIQIITFWHYMGEVDDEVRDFLLLHWQELLLVVFTHEKELGIRQQEGNIDREDLRADAKGALTTFYESVGNCLDSLAITMASTGG